MKPSSLTSTYDRVQLRGAIYVGLKESCSLRGLAERIKPPWEQGGFLCSKGNYAES